VIARLEGQLRDVTPTHVIVDVGGVGYEVHIPLTTFTELPDEGKTVVLRIYTHARDGAIQLFGFLSEAERAAFTLLLHASRVGPRLAQTIMSGIEAPVLLEAITAGNTAVLRGVPGVGSKMAERMIVELRDRTAELSAAIGASGRDLQMIAGPSTVSLDQALSALLNLGYSKPQADRALAAAVEDVGEDATLENLVRGSLRSLSR
jgi:Holliday junction DNA helicase RuvA